MIVATVHGAREIVLDFGRLGTRLSQRIAATMQRLGFMLQATVKSPNLSGGVLHVRTGHLRASIGTTTTVDAGATTTRVGIFGGPTEVYGRVHEYGFRGTVSVREHLRTVRQAFGRPLRNPVFATVRAHERSMDLPERSFLRSALAELRPTIIRDMDAAVTEGLSA